MPNFNGISITEGGQTLLAKAQTGKKLNFSKMQLGSNNDISSPTTKKEVIAPFLTTPITELKLTGDGKARISTYISNKNLKENYIWREIGLFALDPDTGEEVLYAYKCAGENGETLPAGGGSDIIEKIFDIIINISNVTNITAVIDENLVYIKTKDIITVFENCQGKNDKVASAKLLYDEIEKLKSADSSINELITNMKTSIDTTVTKEITDLNTSITNITEELDKKITYDDFVVSTHNQELSTDIQYGGDVKTPTFKKANYRPLAVVGWSTSNKGWSISEVCATKQTNTEITVYIRGNSIPNHRKYT